MTRSLKSVLLAAIFGMAASLCSAEVAILDGVTTVNTPVRITVLTKGRFFSEGGRLVDLYLEGVHLKRIMTGGDGYGYYKITPRSPGYQKIIARSNSDSAEGLLLILTKKDRAIAIEVEQGFKSAVFSEEIQQSSLKAVKTLNKKFKIIYLSRFAGKSITATWLEKHGYPESVILSWRGASTLRALNKKGVQLEAIIGSAVVISEAARLVENRFSFDKTKDGRTVRNWDEIVELLDDNQDP